MISRRTLARAAAAVLAGAWLALPAGAQLASSASFALEGFSLGSPGGGTSSPDHAALVAVSPITSPEMASTNFEAVVGLTGNKDVDLTANTVIWGVSPRTGHRSGGTFVTVSGIGLDDRGPQVPDITFNGVSGTGVSITSNSQIKAFTPATTAGPKTVGFTQGPNSDTRQNAYIATPATIASTEVQRGHPWRLDNYGEVGDSFVMLASTTTTVAPTEFGLLLIGPDILFVILSLPYFPPAGVTSLEFTMPDNPALAGINVFIQNINVSGGGNTLTNRTTTLIH